jgi:hypothetical protein
MAMSNHLRVNNDTAFLAAHAASNIRNISVEGALDIIVNDYKEYLIPGTGLVDYGPDMDGFSPTYKHVMPGCSQGNNVWMLRDWASFRAEQGRPAEAAALRADAKALAEDALRVMYETRDGKGWFNVIHPPANATSPPANASAPPATTTSLVRHEMRHVVDFFSMVFGLCGLADRPEDGCDLDADKKRELASWFREESVAKAWVRATSPECNCSVNATVPYPPLAAAAVAADTAAAAPAAPAAAAPKSYPAFTTCAADRPDHGSNGAYPSWPAFAVEALCYLDGNCSSAFSILASFAPNALEGPFGQSVEVPQLAVPPYTPFDEEPTFKPIAGVNRYIAIEGGSFFEAIVRGFFGYHPPVQWEPKESGGGTARTAQQALDAALVANAKGPRGFAGRLRHLRTPYGLATITADAETGLSIRLE